MSKTALALTADVTEIRYQKTEENEKVRIKKVRTGINGPEG
jgi:hypothetical protein